MHYKQRRRLQSATGTISQVELQTHKSGTLRTGWREASKTSAAALHARPCGLLLIVAPVQRTDDAHVLDTKVGALSKAQPARS